MIVDRKTLYEQVWMFPMHKLCEAYGTTDSRMIRLCSRHKIPRPGRAYWMRKLHGRAVEPTPLPRVSDPRLRKVVIVGVTTDSQPRLYEDVAKVLAAASREPTRLVVPDRLESPHRLVARTLKSLESARPDAKGRLRPRTNGCLDVAVTPATVDRAMRILDAAIKALEARSFRVKAGVGDPPQTVVEALGETISFMMEEWIRRVELPPPEKDDSLYFHLYGRSEPEYEYVPSGELRLIITNAPSYEVQRTYRDSAGRRIETARNCFIDGVAKAAETIRRNRDEAKREREERAELERQAKEAERIREEEEERVRKFEGQLAAWGDSERLRDFIARVRERAEQVGRDSSPGSRLGQWLAWAEGRAERLDPIDRLLRELNDGR